VTARPSFLLTGSSGQVGGELLGVLEQMGDVHAPARAELDLTDNDALRSVVLRVRPTVVVNAAAYTNVDGAERDVALSTQVNATAPGVLAEAAKSVGALMVHYSTDYVFGGELERPITESDATNPLGVYGATKLAGEDAVRASGADHVIIRTSWVYGARGANFMRTILRKAREQEELRVVNDQVGTPTWSRRVALATGEILRAYLAPEASDAARAGLLGTWNVTSAGQASWFEFAREILAQDPRAEEQVCRRVVAIASSEFPSAVKRPAYSVLDTSKFRVRFGEVLPHWSTDLRQVLRS
jgi:dTDP-4-dehydrorhamnose reductase